MSVQILSFGSLTDITGSGNFEVAYVKDTDTLMATLKQQYPALADKKYILAVNAETIRENKLLAEGDTVAILPPFSGG